MSDRPDPAIEPAEGGAGAPALQVLGLSHRYVAAETEALREIAFTVGRGEVFGVLGPNASGKSTLFAILATLLRPAAGTAQVMGHDILTEPALVRSMLGVVFQHPALDPMLSARENLTHHGRLYGMTGAALRQAVAARLEAVGLAERAEEPVATFSGGLRRRIELARAMLHRPPLLLLDEPSVGLDVAARRDLWQSLLALRSANGQSILVTTHLMDEAERCDRLAVLDAGRLVALDTPANLKAQLGETLISIELAPPRPGEAVDPAALEQMRVRIAEQFAPWPAGGEPHIIGDRLFMHHRDGAALVEALTRRHPDNFGHITVGRPTLEDAFLHLTGHRLSG